MAATIFFGFIQPFSNQQCILFFCSLFVLFFPSFLLFYPLLAASFYFSIIQKTPWVSSKVNGLQWEIDNDNLELLLLEPPFNLLSFRTGTRRKWKLQTTKDYIFTTRKTKSYWVSHLQVFWHGVQLMSSGQWPVDPLGYKHVSKTGHVSTSQRV